MTTIAIIGTAGRGETGRLIDARVYGFIKEAIRTEVLRLPRPWNFVSGGAAVVDHVAVDLWLDGFGDNLTLHLPAPFVIDPATETGRYSEESEAGRTSNYYHRIFSDKLTAGGALVDSFYALTLAIASGAAMAVYPGFHARNIPVGEVDVVIAATFGRGSVPADGGTAHTWRNSPAPVKTHISIWDLLRPPAQLSLL